MPPSLPPVHIRRGRESDHAALCRLEQESFTGDRLSPARMLHWLAAENGELWVAEAEGQLLGYGLLICRQDSPAARLYSLAVAAAARGRGVASALLDSLEKAARRRGCTELRLEVASRNAVAIGLYRRMGYVEFQRRANYYEDGDTALRMRKAL